MSYEIVTKAIAIMDAEEAKDRWGSDAFELAAWAAYTAMDSGQQEVLEQLLLKGPVWDGDIISKVARGALFEWGLAVRCCYKGNQGFTVASYRAYTIYKAAGVKKPKTESVVCAQCGWSFVPPLAIAGCNDPKCAYR